MEMRSGGHEFEPQWWPAAVVVTALPIVFFTPLLHSLARRRDRGRRRLIDTESLSKTCPKNTVSNPPIGATSDLLWDSEDANHKSVFRWIFHVFVKPILVKFMSGLNCPGNNDN